MIEGFQTSKVMASLDASQSTEALRQTFADLEATIFDSRQRWLPRLSKSRLTQSLNQCAALGVRIMIPGDSNWPAGLDDLQYAAPAMLFLEGNPATVSGLETAVSIVGSRACSSYGVQVTNRLVQNLAEAKRPTVSGGALGIDASVHQASLEHGIETVAVMAGGLDRKYPSANFPLFRRIKSHGVIVSELHPGVAPTRWRFLQRNRLIAALTPTTVVVEAGIRSGSIRTANNALELDRDLFAVPGSVLSGNSAGTNALIASGRAQALNHLEFFATGRDEPIGALESALAKRAYDAIRELGHPRKLEIARGAGLTDSELTIALHELMTEKQIIEERSNQGQLHYALKYVQ
jgi:DNA processing protein